MLPSPPLNSRVRHLPVILLMSQVNCAIQGRVSVSEKQPHCKNPGISEQLLYETSAVAVAEEIFLNSALL